MVVPYKTTHPFGSTSLAPLSTTPRLDRAYVGGRTMYGSDSWLDPFPVSWDKQRLVNPSSRYSGNYPFSFAGFPSMHTKLVVVVMLPARPPSQLLGTRCWLVFNQAKGKRTTGGPRKRTHAHGMFPQSRIPQPSDRWTWDP